MSHYIINKHEFKSVVDKIYTEEQTKIINEHWNRLTESEKIFAIEILKVIYPEKSKQINEATGWNTFFDFVGILDPSGAVDFLNGLSYWSQGDRLFAILSWVSVIPYLGDVLAKPVIGLLKVGGESIKAFRAATVAGDAVKIAEAAGKSGGVVAKFVEKSPSWGAKLLEILDKAALKHPAIKRFIKLVREYISLFVSAGKEMKAGGALAKEISVAEKETLKQTFRGFRDFGGFKNKYFKYIFSKDVPMWNKFAAGMPRAFGGNPAVRSLMRRTKWYLGFLDFLGIVDSKTTPDELLEKHPELSDKINEYNKTTEAQKNWSQDFGSGEGEVTQQSDGGMGIKDIAGINPLEVFLNPLFK